MMNLPLKEKRDTLLPKGCEDIYISNKHYDIVEKVVAQHYGVSADYVLNTSRKRRASEIRHVTMYLMTLMNDISLVRIGMHSNTDHSTVIYARNKIEGMIEMYPDFRKKISSILEDIQVEIEKNKSHIKYHYSPKS